ncbi:MAG: hypothetical protein HC906_04545 [Bacteroidales bacterium]|nr:hypothetical protein [Bacteroidales bacterium]
MLFDVDNKEKEKREKSEVGKRKMNGTFYANYNKDMNSLDNFTQLSKMLNE